MIAKRLLQCVPVLFVVSLLAFYIVYLAPGDPAAVYRGNDMSAAEFEVFKNRMGFNDPIYQQYGRWLWNVLKGDWGVSLSMKRPVLDLVLERLPSTLGLMLCTIALSALLAVPLGLLAGAKHGKWPDHLISGVTSAGVSMPTFWLGLLLIIVFSLKLSLFPSTGMHTAGAGGFGDLARHAALPMAALGFDRLCGYARYIRAGVIQQMAQPYAVTAKAKGLPPRLILTGHVLKNSLLPVVTLVGMSIGSLVMGAFTVEMVFGWPGLGMLCFGAISNRDFPLIMGSTMLSCLLLITGNLLADILYRYVDPRIRAESGAVQ